MAPASPRLSRRPPPSSFVGRDEEMAALLAALDRGSSILSIVGGPGVGKTRLALEVAAVARVSVPLFCDLSEARALDEVCALLATELGLSPGSDGDAALPRALAGFGPAVAVLDNCEHLVEVLARALPQWRQIASEMCFVVTSRERLRCIGEEVFRIDALSVPKLDDDLEGILRSHAVELFVSRARAVDHRFDPGEDPAAIGQLVRALEGLPLAIELAAGRVGVLGTRALAERTHSALDLLDRGERDRPPRHRSLRAAIDVSWRALSIDERRVLTLLSICAGPMPLRDIEAFVGEAVATPVLDLVHSLCDKSLLSTAVDATSTRFAPLHAIAEFAREQATADELSAAWQHHTQHFLDLGETLAARKHSSDAAAALRQLVEIRAELIVIFEAALEASPTSDVAMRAALALDLVTFRHGPFARQVDCITRALEAAPGLDEALVARALEARGRHLRALGDIDASRRDFEAGLGRATGATASKLSYQLGSLALETGDLEEAAQLFEEARRLAETSGDRAGVGVALGGLARYHRLRGRLEEALGDYHRAIAVDREVGNRFFEAVHLGNQGNVENDLGRLDEARQCYERAIDIFREFRSRRDAAIFQCNLGNVQRQRGDSIAAHALLEAGVAELWAVGERRSYAVCLGYLGDTELEAGDAPRAGQRYRQALEILQEVRDPINQALLCARAAVAASLVGETDEARALASEAERLIEGTASPSHSVAVSLHVALTRSSADPGRARSLLAYAKKTSDATEELRLARSWLSRRLAELEPMADALVVGPRGEWFRTGHADPIDLRGKQQLARVLHCLAGQRERVDGSALSADEIFALAWAGERALEEGRRNRVRVSIAGLRKLGLGDYLQSGNGYRLRRDRAVERGLSSYEHIFKYLQ